MPVLRKGSEQEDCGRKGVEDGDGFLWMSSETLFPPHSTWPRSLFILLGRNRLMRKPTCLFPSCDRFTKKIHVIFRDSGNKYNV